MENQRRRIYCQRSHLAKTRRGNLQRERKLRRWIKERLFTKANSGVHVSIRTPGASAFFLLRFASSYMRKLSAEIVNGHDNG